MPRYFFDTDDGDRLDEDGEGLDLPDMNAARREALVALPDMVRGKLPGEDRHTFAVRIRDEANAVLYSATFDLVGEWHVTPPG